MTVSQQAVLSTVPLNGGKPAISCATTTVYGFVGPQENPQIAQTQTIPSPVIASYPAANAKPITIGASATGPSTAPVKPPFKKKYSINAKIKTYVPIFPDFLIKKLIQFVNAPVDV